MSAKDIRRTFGKGEPYFPDKYSSYYIASSWTYELDYETSPGNVTVWYPTYYSYNGINWYQGAWIMGRQQDMSYEDTIYGVTVLNNKLYVFYTGTVRSYSLSSIRGGSSDRLVGSYISSFGGSRNSILYNINEKKLYHYDTNYSYDVFFNNGSSSTTLSAEGITKRSTYDVMDYGSLVRMDWMYKNKQVVLSRKSCSSRAKSWSIFDLNGNEINSYSTTFSEVEASVFSVGYYSSCIAYDKTGLACFVTVCNISTSRYSDVIIYVYDIYGTKVVKSKEFSEFGDNGNANTAKSTIVDESGYLYVNKYRSFNLTQYDFLSEFKSSDITLTSVSEASQPSIILPELTMFGSSFRTKYNTKSITGGVTDTTGLSDIINGNNSYLLSRSNITGKL